ncbi:hypothetical protein SLEP1_g49190 [Rubroshorea leprosula]|uniref:Uncharacterized protein n=1 Tax=Rubroshorea leprosula TaxID=152421 RepID=A0AAV5LW10_9ROSI|nr:hypothetical protein SLEP1_g49190 [Rubroshorea leprosula]
MSSGPVGRVSQQDKQLVQKLIERCLQHYMNQEEVVETLLDEAEIEPSFTELVWQNLEEENREFFEAYYLRLMVKHQIIEYNKLLEQQVQLMHQMRPTGFSSISTSNGSHIPPMPQNSACYPLENAGPSLKQEDFHHPIAPSLPNVFTNGSSSVHTGMYAAVEIPAHPGRVDAPPAMLSSQSSNMGLMQGINGRLVKPEPGFAGSTPYMFGADGNVLEACPPFGDASVAVASFGGVESSSQPLNDPLLDADISSIGILDILESYASSPFLATDNENFFESHEREHQGDNRRLDTIQERLSFKDYGQ